MLTSHDEALLAHYINPFRTAVLDPTTSASQLETIISNIPDEFRKPVITQPFPVTGLTRNTREQTITTAIHCAARNGNAEICKLLAPYFVQHENLLHSYHDAKSLRDETGDTPLHIAVKKNDYTTAKALIELKDTHRRKGIDTHDHKGATALHYAQTAEMVNLLLDYDADVTLKNRNEASPILNICRYGSVAAVQEIMKELAKINSGFFSRLLGAHYSNIEDTDRTDHNALEYAARGNNTAVVNHLLANHPALATNQARLSALRSAIKYQNADMARALSNNDPSWIKAAREYIIVHALEQNQRDGKTPAPLHQAAKTDNAEWAEYLLELGFDKNATTAVNGLPVHNHLTPLHVAAARNSYRVASLLCTHGADIDTRTACDLSALEIANFQISADCVLARAAEAPNPKNDATLTALIAQGPMLTRAPGLTTSIAEVGPPVQAITDVVEHLENHSREATWKRRMYAVNAHTQSEYHTAPSA
jgi:ankyrin repeat protein